MIGQAQACFGETKSPRGAEFSGILDGVGREIGIPAIGLAPWGSHFCQFYRGKQDLIDTLVPYFQRGLAANELCIWVTSDSFNADEALEALGASVPDLDQRVSGGQMAVRPYTEWFLNRGTFDPARVVDELNRRLAIVSDRGFDGLRIAGDAAWVGANTWCDFVGYERTVNDLVRGRRILALCTYSIDGCSASDVLDVVANHQFALVKCDEWMLLEPSERKVATEAVEQMNRQLRQRTDELQAALSDLRGFSAMVSHDLRNPLCSISMLGEDLAEHCPDLDYEGREILRQIRRNADRMQSLVANVLDFSLAQRAEPIPRALEMAALVRAAYDQFAAEVAGRTIELRVSALPPAMGDPGLIIQVLANLLGNALKYSRGRTVTRIEVEAERAGLENIYHVRDNGIGFDMADAGKLFAIFQRLPGAGQAEGTGVGLAIVQQIIGSHGGRVWADSRQGHGATFSFTLPAVRER